jgi:hypothetical protein
VGDVVGARNMNQSLSLRPPATPCSLGSSVISLSCHLTSLSHDCGGDIAAAGALVVSPSDAHSPPALLDLTHHRLQPVGVQNVNPALLRVRQTIRWTSLHMIISFPSLSPQHLPPLLGTAPQWSESESPVKEKKEWSGNEPEKKQYKDTSTGCSRIIDQGVAQEMTLTLINS